MMRQYGFRIGVISDTHGLLREEVLVYLKTCDYIFHGGDINKPEIINELQSIAPLYVVRGNNDKGIWAEKLPHELHEVIEGLNIYMVHNQKEMSSELGDAKLVIYGHSHRYELKKCEGRLFLNPGSCGKRRFSLPLTMAIVTVTGGNIEVECKTIDPVS